MPADTDIHNDPGNCHYQDSRDLISKPIKNFTSIHDDLRKCLILDGTGPCVTMHLPYLSGAGLSVIQHFDEVHAFSGGVFSYLFFLAYEAGHYRHPMDTYYKNLDKQVRKAHNKRPFQIVQLMKNLLLGRPLYDDQYYQEIFNYAFSKEFLAASLNEVAPNFYPYVAVRGLDAPVPISAEHGFDRNAISVYDVMLHAMRIPLLYGNGNTKTPYFDANYARDFRRIRKALIDSEKIKTLVMTMWNRSGSAENGCYVNILDGKNANFRFRTDILSIAFNVPNPRYTQDLYKAYG